MSIIEDGFDTFVIGNRLFLLMRDEAEELMNKLIEALHPDYQLMCPYCLFSMESGHDNDCEEEREVNERIANKGGTE